MEQNKKIKNKQVYNQQFWSHISLKKTTLTPIVNERVNDWMVDEKIIVWRAKEAL